ncbi:ABC transporter permease [Microbacteriaceae bacterium VKM Ac-2855]|nr:ABC transporter permease [Microbacteriaceae bacterium VKM Ac-2855]
MTAATPIRPTTTRRPTRSYRPPSFAQSVVLVTQREITMRLRSKAFLISTGVLLLAVLASIVIGALVGQNPSLPKIAVVESVASNVDGDRGLDVRSVADASAAEALVRDGTVDAAVVPDTSPLGYAVVGLSDAPSEVVSALSVSPNVTLLEPDSTNPFLAYFVAIGFGLVFFMSALTFGQTIAQSVVEEKQTRIVEILMSTIPVRALLAGKVIGNSLLALAQIVAIALLSGAGLAVTGQNDLVASLGPSLVWFVVFFLFGFVMIASLYSALAALVSRQEDVGSATSPVTILVMAPYLLILMFNGNAGVLSVMSYVPFSATVAMPMRIFLGDAQWWEPLLSLLLLIATTAVIILIGARIYENSLLRTGSRVKLLEALRG